MLLTGIATVDEVLHAHAARLGGDFTAYHNHVYRVVNLCAALAFADGAQVEKIAIAAVFHDLGIWTEGTFDYLPPSILLARAHLALIGRPEWAPEIVEMIAEHHKILPYRRNPEWLVEPFRRADWADVTLGLRTFGLPRGLVREIYAAWPAAGFHGRLVQLSLRRLRSHPLSPLSMFRL